MAESRKLYPELLRRWPRCHDSAMARWLATPQEKMGTGNFLLQKSACTHFHTPRDRRHFLIAIPGDKKYCQSPIPATPLTLRGLRVPAIRHGSRRRTTHFAPGPTPLDGAYLPDTGLPTGPAEALLKWKEGIWFVGGPHICDVWVAAATGCF